MNIFLNMKEEAFNIPTDSYFLSDCISPDETLEDNNFFKGEPVNTPYGEGYIMEDYIEDFNPEENLKKSSFEKRIRLLW